MASFFGGVNDDEKAKIVAEITGHSLEAVQKTREIVDQAYKGFDEVWRKAVKEGIDGKCEPSHLIPTLLGSSLQMSMIYVEMWMGKTVGIGLKNEILKNACFAVLDSMAKEKNLFEPVRDSGGNFQDKAPPFSEN